MIELRASDLWGRRYKAWLDDVELSELSVSIWKIKADFEWEGDQYHMYTKGGAFKPSYFLSIGGHNLAEAKRLSVWNSNKEIRFNRKLYEYKMIGWATHNSEIRLNGELVGSIKSKGVFKTRIQGEFHKDLPFPFQFFLIWIVLVKIRQAQASG